MTLHFADLISHVGTCAYYEDSSAICLAWPRRSKTARYLQCGEMQNAEGKQACECGSWATWQQQCDNHGLPLTSARLHYSCNTFLIPVKTGYDASVESGRALRYCSVAVGNRLNYLGADNYDPSQPLSFPGRFTRQRQGMAPVLFLNSKLLPVCVSCSSFQQFSHVCWTLHNVPLQPHMWHFLQFVQSFTLYSNLQTTQTA